MTPRGSTGLQTSRSCQQLNKHLHKKKKTPMSHRDYMSRYPDDSLEASQSSPRELVDSFTRKQLRLDKTCEVSSELRPYQPVATCDKPKIPFNDHI